MALIVWQFGSTAGLHVFVTTTVKWTVSAQVAAFVQVLLIPREAGHVGVLQVAVFDGFPVAFMVTFVIAVVPEAFAVSEVF